MYNTVKNKDKPLNQLLVDLALLEIRDEMYKSGFQISLDGTTFEESEVLITNHDIASFNYYSTLSYRIGTDWIEEVYSKGLAIVDYRQTPTLVLKASEVPSEKLTGIQKAFKVTTVVVDSEHEKLTTRSGYSYTQTQKKARVDELYAVTEEQSDGRFLVYCGQTLNRALSSMRAQQKKRIKKSLGI